MGSLEGMQGAWSYVQGGMGALSDAIASSATTHGASIFTEKVWASPPTLTIGLDAGWNRFRETLEFLMNKVRPRIQAVTSEDPLIAGQLSVVIWAHSSG